MNIKAPRYLNYLFFFIALISVVGCKSGSKSSEALRSQQLPTETDHETYKGILFQPETISSFRLEAPFTELIERAKNWEPPVEDDDCCFGLTSISPPQVSPPSGMIETSESEKPKARATISYRSNGELIELSGELSVRGMSSVQDCSFPKLKMKLDQNEKFKKSIFRENSVLRIATHCSAEIGSVVGMYGRLAGNEPLKRESFVYKLVELLGMHTHRTKLASIDYDDTVEGGKHSGAFDALFIEDFRDAATRQGGEIVKVRSKDNTDDPNRMQYLDNASQLDRTQVLKTYLVQGLIGNHDWYIEIDDDLPESIINAVSQPRLAPFGNIEAIKIGSNTYPLLYDFDLAHMVTQSKFSKEYPESFFGNDPTKQHMFKIIQSSRRYFSKVEIQNAFRSMLSDLEQKNRLIQRLIEQSEINSQGKKFVGDQIEKLISLMSGEGKDFFVPMSLSHDHKVELFSSAENAANLEENDGQMEGCNGYAQLPLGSPIKVLKDDIAKRVKLIAPLDLRGYVSQCLHQPKWVKSDSLIMGDDICLVSKDTKYKRYFPMDFRKREKFVRHPFVVCP